MASNDADIGGLNDSVTLHLGERIVAIAEQYEIRQSFFTVPGAFSITLGHGNVAAGLIKQYPPNTDFELRIGDVAQMVGKTDGIQAHGNSGATTLTIRGRDTLAPLHDACAPCDRSFSEATYKDLVAKVLTAAGIQGYALVFTDEGNRKKAAGAPVKQTSVPVYFAEVLADLPVPQKKTLQAKAGEHWYHYLKRELDQAGLFLFAGVDGTFILTAPNPHQKALYRIFRQRGALRNVVNVEDFRWKNETTGRYSTYTVLGRGGGGADGRSKLKGVYEDAEMKGLGIERPFVKKNKHATTSKQCEFYARKYAAEANRHASELVYKVAGHTTAMLGGGGRRAIWTVDTIVEVVDQELGIEGNFWIESITRSRAMSGGTTSELVLNRVEDLIYGGSDE